MADRISKDVFPEEYNIILDIDMFKWTFKGKETIAINVSENIRRVSMNAVGLVISKALSADQTAKISINKSQEIVHFDFDDYLQCGSNELTISFKGELNTDLKGLYRSIVTENSGKTTRIAVTQFQPTNARSCFPCWDSPEVKAAFRLTITTAEDFQVLSNMPVLSRSQLSGGRVRVSFASSPRMSTYVFGFAVGHFSAVEKVLPGQLKLRVNGTAGMPEAGLFALNVAAKALAYFEDYFGIRFPLPKLDLVALPELSPDGMEHWGFITFRDSALLLDPAKSSPQAQKAVALVVCHEVAHQWFGNLVTMRSWTDLWLNEGFASFLMYKCAMVCAPGLVDSTDFIVRELHHAFEVDALQSTHPLQAPECRSVEDVLDSFDAVSYSKGAALIMMLHDFLGADMFRHCLQNYLEQFQFGCASSADLWNTFTRCSGQPLAKVLRSWVDNAGYPLVSVSLRNNELTLKQQQFLADGTPGPPDKMWCVPITIATSEQPKMVTKRFFLCTEEKKVTVGDILKGTKSFKLNVQTTGVYRVLYDGSLLDIVVGCAEKFAVNDRIGLMDDLFALARAGRISTRLALEHSLTFLGETNVNFWRCFDACVWSLGGLTTACAEGGGRAYRAFLLHVFEPQFLRLGWASRAPADHLLRPLVLLRLGAAGHPGVLRAARRRFWRHVRGGKEVPAELHSAVFAAVLHQGGAKELDAALELFRNAAGRERNRIIQALGFTAAAQLHRVFDFALRCPMRPQQRLDVVQSCAAATPEGRRLTWRFAQRHWPELAALCDGLFGVGELITTLCFDLVGQEEIREMEDFFKQHSVGSPAAVRQCTANVKVTTAQLERDGAEVVAFFQRFLPRGEKRKRQNS